MNYNKFGLTDEFISRIGFGTWGLSGTSYGFIDEQIAIQTLQMAYEHGINFFDSADLYGNGRSEEILSKALNQYRNKIYLATKGGSLPHSGFVMPQDFSVSYLDYALKNSLKRMRTEYVDLYQLHSPDLTELDMDTVIGFLQDKVQEGTIRYYGISFRTPGDALSVINDYPLDAIQINYNLIDQRAKEIGLLDRCLEKGIAVIVRTPLCFGFLTGRFTGEEIFTPPDHRSNWPREQIRRWARSAQLFTPLVESYHRTLPQLALAFCTDHAAVTTVIPGMMNPIEVRENVGTIQNIVLTDKDRRFIRDVYHNHIFFDPSIQSKITAKTVNIREGVA